MRYELGICYIDAEQEEDYERKGTYIMFLEPIYLYYVFRETEEGGRRLFPHFPADMRLIKKKLLKKCVTN